ncbi:MAG: cyclic nucleotide-binding domain-containing protein [Myxococcaceae bacterium]|jgi:CRP/FNR family cyclic AMP-dependent transcriptional regulator|nr:cyclic nucleotide-binding domain-containing protein [Myxococcaceae bacterium]MCA3011591.1 cyclic nucleotide-binding domain-containing protein [Myxococcaceae bacterium]
MDASAALRASPLFAGFTDTGVAILASIAAVRSYPAGSPLFFEDMMSDTLVVIGSGRVSLSARGARGGDLALGEFGPGDWLGELSLITAGQRQCTAMALTPVTTVEIRQGDFQRLMGIKPQACIKLLMAICTTFGQKIVSSKDALKTLVKP